MIFTNRNQVDKPFISMPDVCSAGSSLFACSPVGASITVLDWPSSRKVLDWVSLKALFSRTEFPSSAPSTKLASLLTGERCGLLELDVCRMAQDADTVRPSLSGNGGPASSSDGGI